MTTCLGKSCSFGLLSVCVLHERLSICACVSLSFGFEGEMWNLIILVPDHCLSFYFGRKIVACIDHFLIFY